MRISEVAIFRPVFTWMIMAALILFGYLSYLEMGVSQLPDVDYPVVNIRVELEGAAPEVMETQVVDPLESAVLAIQGIQTLTSSAKSGSANITVEFDLGKDIDVAVQEVQTRLAQAQRKLPEETEAPTVSKQNPEDRPILWLSVKSEKMSRRELMDFVRDRLKDHFTTLPGVSEVFMGGYIDPNLRVSLSAEKLRRYALTVDDVLSSIEREHSELPAGRIEMTDKEINIRMLGEASTVEEFKNIVINRRGGSPNFRPITLSQVSEVEDSLADVRRISRSNGQPSVGLGIVKQRGSNSVAVAEEVKAKMESIRPLMPQDVQLGVNFDSTKFIRESVEELVFTLILSALLTAIICWMFLGSWSATMNVVLAIPTSIIGSFIILGYLDFTLNTFTLLGLSLAIGIVVDDAIMVLENIVRHYESGKNRIEASVIGVREIAFAALAATAAIIAIFLPVAFMKGVIGRYFFQFGVTISVAVALSLLEALTLTPMRCSQFLKITQRTTRFGHWIENSFEKLENHYRSILPIILRHRVKIVLASVIFFVASASVGLILKKEFVPSQDQSLLMVRMKTPEGSSLHFTDTRLKQVEDILSKNKNVSSYFSSVGGFGGGDVNTGMVFVTLKPINERELTQQQIADEFRKTFKAVPQTQVFIQDLSMSGFGGQRGFPIEFTLRGPEWTELVKLSQTFVTEIEKSPMLTDVNSDFTSGMPEVQLIPDRIKAAEYGVSVNDIGKTLNALVGGVVAGMYTKGGKRYDIRVRLKEEERSKVEDIQKLYIRNNRGELVPLSHLVQAKNGFSAQSISRINRERSIGINANVATGASQAKAMDMIQDLAKKTLPAGYYVAASGSSKTFKESFSSLNFALMLGILVSYMVLASQFNSFLHPITVLVALPFSVSGAFLSLWIGGQSLNIYSMIGLILLMGIVKKNSILLVDFTNQLRGEGLNINSAIIEACPIRLRPILMTSTATISAAIPPALSFGPGAESTIPMAISVIGGVTVSTFLTLLVVPCFYSLVTRGGSFSASAPTMVSGMTGSHGHKSSATGGAQVRS